MKDMIKDDFKKIGKYKNIIKLIGIVLLFIYIEYIKLIPIIIFNIKEIAGPIAVILDAFKNVILILILFFIYRKDILKEWDIFRANMVDNVDAGVKYWFVGLLCMVISNLVINLVFKTNGAGNEQAVQEYISYMPWMMLINAGILGPFIEEIVFRKTFKDAFKKKWLFVLLSALVFGGMHVIGNIHYWYDVLYIIPYGCLGGAFALAYNETETVFTSITLHTIHNCVLVMSAILTAFIMI